MSVRDVLFARRNKLESFEVEDIGTVHARRLSAEQMLAIFELPDDDFAYAVVHHSICEADGRPIYESLAEVKSEEFSIFNAFSTKALQLNRVGKDEAAKK